MILFLSGLFIGAFLGIFVMCLCQVGKDDKWSIEFMLLDYKVMN